MEILWVVFLVIIFTVVAIILAAWLPVFLQSSLLSMAKENASLRKQYLTEIRSLNNAHRNVQKFLNYWPIWPRPVLYIDIDTKIQYAFAQFTNIFTMANLEENEVGTVSSDWLNSSKFKRFPLFDWLQLRELVTLHRVNLEKIKKFGAQAQEQSKLIVSCYAEIGRREIKVRDEVAAWKHKSKEYTNGIIAGGKENTNEYLRTSHILESLCNAVDEGKSCLEQKSTSDGVQFARAEICNQTAREVWRQFRLDYEILQEEDNFEIDESGQILDQTEPALRLILVNVRNDHWSMLQKLRRDIQHVHNQIMLADLLFGKFKESKKELKRYLSKLQDINPNFLLEVAGRQEYILNKLWYEYPEWERLLGGKQEPSRRLEDAKLKWELYLQPKVDVGGVIKQSIMQNLVEQINSFQILIKEIQDDVQSISREISEQEISKERVKLIFIPTSALSSSLAKLLSVKDDTSDDVSIRAATYQISYQAYRAKIDGVNGPNYRKLEGEVIFFKKEVFETLNTHVRLITERRENALIARSTLKSTYEDLLKYKNPPLAFNNDWAGINRLYVTHEQKYQIAVDSFRKLQEYSESARVRQVEWRFLVKSFSDRLQDFVQKANLEYSRILDKDKERIELLSLFEEFKWKHLLVEFRNEIARSQTSYQNLRAQLRLLMKEEWIDTATKKLDTFPGRMNLVEQNVKRAFFEAQKIDRDIERRYQSALLGIPLEYRNTMNATLTQLLYSAKSPAQAYNEIDRVRRLKAVRDISFYIGGSVDRSNINVGGDSVSQST
jgi:hypothetical protein